MKGYIHAYQSMGTLDGPGIRFLVFLQGCPLRCGYCHNPDTWKREQYQEVAEPEEVVRKVLKYKNYYGTTGGVTLTGGEALMQPEFVQEVFAQCQEEGIHTCLDTSGCVLNEAVRAVLKKTNLVLLDIKMTTEEAYQEFTGGSLLKTKQFLQVLEEEEIPVWIRQVIVPGINDTKENADRLARLIQGKRCIEKVEFLPFRKLCKEKYEKLGIVFPFDIYEEACPETIQKMDAYLSFCRYG